MSLRITRHAYAEMFGPTTGDRVRLADTELWIEVEKDFTTYGKRAKAWRRQSHSRCGWTKPASGCGRCGYGDHECVDPHWWGS